MARENTALMQRENTLISVLNDERVQRQIQKALPAVVTPVRFMRMVMTSVRKTPKLAECDQRSLLSAMLELAQLGLEPDTPLGHAWMIPFNRVVQLVVGYKGMIALAERGARVSMNAEVVYDGDDFDYQLGTDAFLRHVPVADITKRGALKAAYSIARFPDGRPAHFKVVNLADIEEAKAKSSAYQRDKAKMEREKGYVPQSPWFTCEAAMWRKTAVRRHAPFLPLGAEYARIAELDDQQERGEIQVFEPFGLSWAELPAPDPAQQADALEKDLAGVKQQQREAEPPAPLGPAAQSIMDEAKKEAGQKGET